MDTLLNTIADLRIRPCNYLAEQVYSLGEVSIIKYFTGKIDSF